MGRMAAEGGGMTSPPISVAAAISPSPRRPQSPHLHDLKILKNSFLAHFHRIYLVVHSRQGFFLIFVKIKNIEICFSGKDRPTRNQKFMLKTVLNGKHDLTWEHSFDVQKFQMVSQS